MNGTIYKIENLVNGKVYVGQTKQTFKRRIRVHFWSLEKKSHDNPYLQSAYNKYGEANLESSILEICDIKELDDAEIFWIAYYKAFKGVYNLESGGSTNKELHESTRKKMSEVTKSHGWIGGKHPHAKKIIRLNDSKVFESMTEAANEIGTTTGNIYQNCKGNNGACLGSDGVWHQFSYYEEGQKYTYVKYDDKKSKNPKRVICINTKKVYTSTRQASKETGVNQSKISLCCNGKRKHAGRMKNGDYIVWVFEKDYEPNKKYDFKKRRSASN